MSNLRQAAQQALEALEHLEDRTYIDDYGSHALLKGFDPEQIDAAFVALRAALKQPEPYDQTALELCEVCCWKTLIPGDGCLNCERKAQPEQEPVAWWNKTKDTASTDPVHRNNADCQPLYTTQPQRKPLTDDEIRNAIRLYKADQNLMGVNHVHVARAVEAAHGIGEKP